MPHLVKCDEGLWVYSGQGQTGSVPCKQLRKHPDEHSSDFFVLQSDNLLTIKRTGLLSNLYGSLPPSPFPPSDRLLLVQHPRSTHSLDSSQSHTKGSPLPWFTPSLYKTPPPSPRLLPLLDSPSPRLLPVPHTRPTSPLVYPSSLS